LFYTCIILIINTLAKELLFRAYKYAEEVLKIYGKKWIIF